jgi:hypothetical protein
MNAGTKIIITCIVPALLAGCFPEKRVIWSPDGRRAAVATPNGLFFIDPAGKVLEPRLTGSAAKCGWFPDSRRLAVVHATKAKSWSEVGDLFGLEQAGEIEKLAKALRSRVMAYEGDWDDFEIDSGENLPSAIEIAAVVYMRDNLPAGLAEKLGDKWEEVEELQLDIWHLQIFTLSDNELTPGRVLVRTFNDIRRPMVAPNGKNVAILAPSANGSDDAVGLAVVSVDGGELRNVAEFVALGYDWSPDGRSLACVRTEAGRAQTDNIQLGSLTTIRVADEDGKLLRDPEQRNDRVGLLFNRLLGVRWLSDGRLLFSGVEATLPATTQDMPQEWSLFVLDPRTPASVLRVLGRDLAEPVEASVPMFDVSPDGKRVLLPGLNGGVILYEFASGESRSLVDKDDPEGKLRSLPTWRNDGQVCLVRPTEPDKQAPHRGEVVLWKDGEIKSLSGAWPAEMVEGWLAKE